METTLDKHTDLRACTPLVKHNLDSLALSEICIGPCMLTANRTMFEDEFAK